MIKSEKIFLTAFLVMGIMSILLMNIPPRAVDAVKTESSVTLFPVTGIIKKSILQTFKNGKAAYCKPYLTSEVTLSIEAMDGEYTAAQTATALDRFFENNPPKSFNIKHEGTNKTKTEKFWIGEYESIDNVKFLVYTYSEKGKIYSLEISIEELTSSL